MFDPHSEKATLILSAGTYCTGIEADSPNRYGNQSVFRAVGQGLVGSCAGGNGNQCQENSSSSQGEVSGASETQGQFLFRQTISPSNSLTCFPEVQGKTKAHQMFLLPFSGKKTPQASLAFCCKPKPWFIWNICDFISAVSGRTERAERNNPADWVRVTAPEDAQKGTQAGALCLERQMGSGLA